MSKSFSFANLPKSLTAFGRSVFAWLLEPLIRILKPHTGLWVVANLANIISVLRLLASLAVGVGLILEPTYLGRIPWFFAILFIIASDGIDGELARGLGTVSRFGAIFDPLADKVFIGFIGLGLALHFGQGWYSAMVVILLVVEFMNALVGTQVWFLAKKLGKPAGAGDWGKLKFATECVAVLTGWLIPYSGTAFTVSALLFALALPFALMSLTTYLKLLKDHMAELSLVS